MIILGIDTSQSASVALVDTSTATVLAAEQADDPRRHVEFIGPALARVLAHPASPDRVVVGIGPGPFTGLRVGIAAGIAVGAARGIPVHGMLSHAALAEELNALGPVTGPVLVAGDARRREVYLSVYGPPPEPVANGGAGLLAGPFVAAPVDVAEVLAAAGFPGDSAAARIGRGFALYADVLGAPQPHDLLDPKAEHLVMAAARELAAGRELPEPVPEYLREPDAKAAPVRESTLR
ncbi:tRNA threonylcarbamoyl adenosine modification protein YeaZ [Brevibacterium sanguinis]|uniref:tRNA threonylcarbamoyl adenosine modification protein YeaZ n=2 Tax=Brevibacterium TaxID=1696 RepID=A0A366IMV2_9MICO|nr:MULTISPECIES: tRNA (adenosine(37)-N6)-threonylcarbamoyltransferase complex dimerization subunit type 1 TsaB [Brevibacterium]RBP68169.1 tRNA threonylcarbamoyl adenosine modification protein YeaZ [Brevibacterium sanguinis]RBP74414.1 tRNA threonylcarbamoyl adenosine modification protein YeaZ [Brevibacterium celere]